MVGGKVIEVLKLKDKVWIDTRSQEYPSDTCAIYVERNQDSEAVQVGDSIWWQSAFAYWTPAFQQEIVDRAIPRIGSSGVNRPESEAA